MTQNVDENNVQHLHFAVAPHAGAWIEIIWHHLHSHMTPSRPMRARGLKYKSNFRCAYHYKVAPHAGAWIEMIIALPLMPVSESRPMRARGLKFNLVYVSPKPLESRPMRARGLKFYKSEDKIETLCRAPCGRVD